MALNKPEYFQSVTTTPTKRIVPEHAYPKNIAAIGGAPVLAVGTPMAFNTSTNLWVPWTNAGANGTGTIRGFIYPTEVESHATDSVLGVIMVAGEIHHDDVVLYGAETQPNLTAALKAGLSEMGLYVTGIAAAY